MASLEERIAHLALDSFDRLPLKSKPRNHPDGSHEWVPMSAIILVHDENHPSKERLTCVSLATGCKCLPQSLIPTCHGQVLHDSHAEILALRGLNHFLLSEIQYFLAHPDSYSSPLIICPNSPPIQLCRAGHQDAARAPFKLNPDITIHMFSTEAPCGDASMEILMSELGPDGTAPWPHPYPPPNHPDHSDYQHPPSSPSTPSPSPLPGRAFFSDLGIIRRKPSRADAEPTLSKSCTDKFTLKQFTSLLSFPAYQFIERTPNTYLRSLILPEEKYSVEGFARAFSSTGRLESLLKSPPSSQPSMRPGEYFHPFETHPLPSSLPAFPFSKPQPSLVSTKAISKPTNLSALSIYTPCHPPAPSGRIQETLLNGVKQGYTHVSPSRRKASAVSRASLFALGRDVAGLLIESRANGAGGNVRQENGDGGQEVDGDGVDGWRSLLEADTYQGAKTGGTFAGKRSKVKDAVVGGLKGVWLRNSGDEGWGLGI